MLGTLLDRPIIHKIFKQKYQVLVDMCNQELDIVKVVYDQQLANMKTPNGPVVNKNMPKVSGSLHWSQQLHDRIELTIGKLRTLHFM